MFVTNISDKTLTKITVKAKGERLANVAVFPFFDREGKVKQVMLVLPDEQIVCLIPMRQGLVQLGTGHVLKFSMDLAEIKSYVNFNPQQIAGVFHYDPQWTISRPRFSRFWAKELIKKSNCANLLEKKVRNLLFSNDLSAIDGFIMQKGSLNLFHTMTAGIMALAALPEAAGGQLDLPVATQMSGWQLSPIWNEWSRG